MEQKRTTLKELAKAADVSLATVHRALNNKGGVSDEVRGKILSMAAEMQYKPNYAASSLKRKSIKIAVVLPVAEGENRYFYSDVWHGVRTFQHELSDFNLEMLEFIYRGSFSNQNKVLEELYNNYRDRISGIITIAHGGETAAEYINRFKAAGIEVVLICDDDPNTRRLCGVTSNFETIGSISAELLCDCTPAGARFIVAAGDRLLPSHRQTMVGFDRYLSRYDPGRVTFKIQEYYNTQEIISLFKEQLKDSQEEYGVFSCSARHTILLCRTIAEMGIKDRVRVVGSDLFDESVQYIREGILTATIYKSPARQAYLGLQVLTDYLIRQQVPRQDVVMVEGTIILRSNVEQYVRRDSNLILPTGKTF